MTYDELKARIPDANFYYYDVTWNEIINLPVDGWWGQVMGVYYLGTIVEVPSLAAKEVVA